MSVLSGINFEQDGFTLAIDKLEILDKGLTVFWGPSGSGKSTLFRVLLGLEKCDGFSWLVEGKDLAKLSPADKHVSVVFQTLDLFPHLSGRENVLFAARARKMSSGEAEQRLNHLSKILRCDSFWHKSVEILSGGEKQRIALARALITKPRYLFLDEPFTGLDQELSQRTQELIQSIFLEEGIPIILITHDSRDIDTLSKSMPVLVHRLRDGRLLP